MNINDENILNDRINRLKMSNNDSITNILFGSSSIPVYPVNTDNKLNKRSNNNDQESRYILSYFNKNRNLFETIDKFNINDFGNVYGYHIPDFIDDGKFGLIETSFITNTPLTIFRKLIEEIKLQKIDDKYLLIQAFYGKIDTNSLKIQMFCKRQIKGIEGYIVSEQIVILASNLKRKICQLLGVEIIQNLPELIVQVNLIPKIIKV